MVTGFELRCHFSGRDSIRGFPAVAQALLGRVLFSGSIRLQFRLAASRDQAAVLLNAIHVRLARGITSAWHS